jgi:catechol 2,3-dioxygenase-like lactoylglutathione lyase family enzyme
MEIERTHHIGIHVQDLDALEGFLVGCLGLERVRTAPNRGPNERVHYIQCGTIELELIEQPDAPTRLDHIAVKTDDVRAAVEALSAQGIETTPFREGSAGLTSTAVPGNTGGINFQLL